MEHFKLAAAWGILQGGQKEAQCSQQAASLPPHSCPWFLGFML